MLLFNSSHLATVDGSLLDMDSLLILKYFISLISFLRVIFTLICFFGIRNMNFFHFFF